MDSFDEMQSVMWTLENVFLERARDLISQLHPLPDNILIFIISFSFFFFLFCLQFSLYSLQFRTRNSKKPHRKNPRNMNQEEEDGEERNSPFEHRIDHLNKRRFPVGNNVVVAIWIMDRRDWNFPYHALVKYRIQIDSFHLSWAAENENENGGAPISRPSTDLKMNSSFFIFIFFIFFFFFFFSLMNSNDD